MAMQREVSLGRVRPRWFIKGAATLVFLALILASCVAPKTSTPVPSMGAESAPPTVTPVHQNPTAFLAVAPSETAPPPERDTAIPAPTSTPMAAGRTARLRLDADASVVGGGEPLTVRLILEGVEGLYGVQVELAFDPEFVQMVDANPDFPGVQIEPGPAFPRGGSFVALNSLDNEVGSLEFAATRLNPAKPLDGRVEVASFELIALKTGTVDLEFTKVLLADPQANALAVVAENLTLNTKV